MVGNTFTSSTSQSGYRVRLDEREGKREREREGERGGKEEMAENRDKGNQQ